MRFNVYPIWFFPRRAIDEHRWVRSFVGVVGQTLQRIQSDHFHARVAYLFIRREMEEMAQILAGLENFSE
jgi:hypothetical protein